MNKIELEHAIEILKDNVATINQWEDVSLLTAMGRVLYSDYYANTKQPPFDRSPLDGYAVIEEDTLAVCKVHPLVLKVSSKVYAGQSSNIYVGSGECVRLMTGAPIPKGANCVVRQEDTDCGSEWVSLFRSYEPDSNYCHAGEDYESGDVLIEQGTLLNAFHIGLIASTGSEWVRVRRKPVVGVMSTGDELMPLGRELTLGKIYNSNSPMLITRLLELGCDTVDMGIIGDDVLSSSKAFQRDHEKVDMFITTGGVSVGERDIMVPLFESMSVRILFHGLKLKPGTPGLAGVYKDKPILSLSGNPSAAAVTFELLARPMIAKATACSTLEIKRERAILTASLKKNTSSRRFLKGICMNGRVSMTKGNHSSGALSALVDCNCLIDIPEGNGELLSGAEVDILKM